VYFLAIACHLRQFIWEIGGLYEVISYFLRQPSVQVSHTELTCIEVVPIFIQELLNILLAYVFVFNKYKMLNLVSKSSEAI